MSTATPAISTLKDAVRQAVRRVAAFRAIVTATDTGLVEIRRIEAATADGELYARVAGFSLAADDEVLVVPVAGQPVIVGKLQRAAPTDYALDAPLTVQISDAEAFAILQGGGFPVVTVKSSSPTAVTINAPLTVRALNTPLWTRKSQSAADTPSTTNTSTLVDAMAHVLTLGAGTWRVRLEGGANFAHSNSQVLDRRMQLVEANLTTHNGTIAGATMLTTREHYAVDHVVDGIAGDQIITGKMQYRGGAGTSGTSSVRAPYMNIYAERTA